MTQIGRCCKAQRKLNQAGLLNFLLFAHPVIFPHVQLQLQSVGGFVLTKNKKKSLKELYNTAHRKMTSALCVICNFLLPDKKNSNAMFCFLLNLSVFSSCSGGVVAFFFPVSVPYVQYIKCILAAHLKQLEISHSRKTREKIAQSVFAAKTQK